MNTLEILASRDVYSVGEVDVRQLYEKVFNSTFATARPDTNKTQGVDLAFVLEVPHINNEHALFCSVEANPTACLYFDNEVCKRIPTNYLLGCSGSLMLGISALGIPGSTPELLALRALGLPGRFKRVHYFYECYSQANPNQSSSTVAGMALAYKGFGISGTTITQEIYFHSDIKYAVLSCTYHGCLLDLNIQWFGRKRGVDSR